MTTVMRAPLKMLTEGEMPSADDIRACFNAIMDGEISQIQMAAFLTALKMRGERVEDIAAAAAVMREKATVIDAPDSAMDIVGTGGDGIGTYNISKAADFQMVRNLAAEYGPKGIRVNAIAPGLIRTDFARALWENPTTLERVTSTVPLRRIGEPEELAGVAVFLASKAGSYSTGQNWVVDGGSTIV